jgi:spore coat protein U-like protein
MMAAPLRLLSLASFAAALALLVVPDEARAQSCSGSASNLTFGAIDTLSTTSADQTTQVRIDCTGTRGRTVWVCLHIGDGSGGSSTSLTPRYLRSGANTLSFDLYTDPGRTIIWGSGVFQGQNPRGPLVDTVQIGSDGSGSKTFTMYGRVFGGQPTTPLGTYSSSFGGNHTILYYSYAQNCAAGASSSPGFAFNVSAQVSAKCLVGGSNILDFGSRGLLSTAFDASTTIDVRCTPGTPYAIALGAGTGPGATITNRRMKLGAETIAYQLYTNMARTNVWGDGTTGSVVGGTGTGNAPNLYVYGRVPPQPTPSAGTYADTVVVTVTY